MSDTKRKRIDINGLTLTFYLGFEYLNIYGCSQGDYDGDFNLEEAVKLKDFLDKFIEDKVEVL